METLQFEIGGEVGLSILLTRLDDGSIQFDLEKTGEPLADLRGLFFDFNDPALLSSLSIEGLDVSKTAFDDDSVTNLGEGVNMNGAGKFDVGVAFGSAGIGEDDIFATSFTISSSQGPLSLEAFANAEFGVRFTSVGYEGQREDSLKLVAISPEYEPYPDLGVIA